MEEFIVDNHQEIVATVITLVVLVVLNFISTKAIRKIGRISDLNQARTRLIIKYVTIGLLAIGIGALTFIWGVNFKEIGLLLSSIFAVIGVALFASWSILSNITAGIILFFSFPFKIGDRIRILDSDFPEEADILDIKAFHVYLRKDNGELVTYPNNLLLQKGVALIAKNTVMDDDTL
ncbi:mechanosensitive ion channel [Maribacter polysiphoniae]|uniref:Mechanosensitive ion channel n=1 Tax=Maribacter polysiphoniae TaxID=429344 RepID=A0A316DTS9_9FLAO|nr:mechanosensitive ion channel domain-containing protein [Maribacter polysiphoniae]MBD1262541.1 mechanosensitive ion channel [Maribacter polysiphoniae]PWK21375.1 mechanosensitive ion channel-like protein [Maribacter polysiphoniae]